MNISYPLKTIKNQVSSSLSFCVRPPDKLAGFPILYRFKSPFEDKRIFSDPYNIIHCTEPFLSRSTQESSLLGKPKKKIKGKLKKTLRFLCGLKIISQLVSSQIKKRNIGI